MAREKLQRAVDRNIAFIEETFKESVSEVEGVVQWLKVMSIYVIDGKKEALRVYFLEYFNFDIEGLNQTGEIFFDDERIAMINEMAINCEGEEWRLINLLQVIVDMRKRIVKKISDLELMS